MFPPEPPTYLAVILEDALGASGIEVSPVEGFPGVLTGEVGGTIGRWTFFAQPDNASQGILVYSVFPTPVPPDRRADVAELAARANYVLRYGNLEMDFADGEVRARTSARGGAEPLEFNVVAELVRANLEIAEWLFPLVRRVALEGAAPGTAMASLLQTLGGG
jgi:hypothetical protein